MSRAWPCSLVLVLAACLAVAACQRHADSDRDQQHSGGFYGGVTGGAAHP
ncbi:MAG TPA: hypothetical protein VND87_12080 [Stellaceae bacterium]|nr:hypothetical protein [Stellaceae bacterium]